MVHSAVLMHQAYVTAMAKYATEFILQPTGSEIVGADRSLSSLRQFINYMQFDFVEEEKEEEDETRNHLIQQRVQHPVSPCLQYIKNGRTVLDNIRCDLHTCMYTFQSIELTLFLVVFVDNFSMFRSTIKYERFYDLQRRNMIAFNISYYYTDPLTITTQLPMMIYSLLPPFSSQVSTLFSLISQDDVEFQDDLAFHEL